MDKTKQRAALRTHQVGVRFTGAELAKLQSLAEHTQRTHSDVIRLLVGLATATGTGLVMPQREAR